jgi:hypothetical protein
VRLAIHLTALDSTKQHQITQEQESIIIITAHCRHPQSTTPNNRRTESARSNSHGKVWEDDLLMEAGLAVAGEDDGWDEDAKLHKHGWW